MKPFEVAFWGAVVFMFAVVSAGFLPSMVDSREQGIRKGTAEHRWRRAAHLGPEGPWISIILRHRNELQLSGDQVSALENVRSDFRSQAGSSWADLREVEKEIARLLNEDALDLVQVKAKVEEAEKFRAAFRLLRIEALERGRSVLTAAQQEQLKSLSASMRGRFQRHRAEKS